MSENVMHLTGTDCQAVVGRMQAAIRSNRTHLSELDAALGDGDHGVNLHNALHEANEGVMALVEPLPHEVFALVGSTVRNQMGGAAGAIFGSFFTGGSRAIQDRTEVGLTEIASFFAAGIDKVQKRGKAVAGDKTILDALIPAAAILDRAAANGDPFVAAVTAAAEAAQAGATATKEMVAQHGRAKFLGDRALGHQDAGATSMALMVTAWAEFIADY